MKKKILRFAQNDRGAQNDKGALRMTESGYGRNAALPAESATAAFKRVIKYGYTPPRI